MKKLMTALMMLIGLTSFSQDTWTEVVIVDSTNASTLYSKAKLWVANTYNSGKSVTDLSDENTHTIIIKAQSNELGNNQNLKGLVAFRTNLTCGYIEYTLKIYCKDNRFKYEITNINHVWHTSSSPDNDYSGGDISNDIVINKNCLNRYKWDKIWIIVREESTQYLKNLINNLKNNMIKKSEIQKNDW